jgi:hypothetical protein
MPEPSSLQAAYSEEVARRISNLLMNELREIQPSVRHDMGPTSDQIPPIPQSMAFEWVGQSTEALRHKILAYFKETGLFP